MKLSVSKKELQIYPNLNCLPSSAAQFCQMGLNFYRWFSGLSDGVVGSALQGLTAVPDFRLRAVVRTFLKSLINKCPESQFSSGVTTNATFLSVSLEKCRSSELHFGQHINWWYMPSVEKKSKRANCNGFIPVASQFSFRCSTSSVPTCSQG